MSLETNSTSVNDLIHSSLIAPELVRALSEQALTYRYARQFNMQGLSAPSLSIPTQTSSWGSPNDRGVAVDTELDGAEGVALGNTQISTGTVTLTPSEFGVQATVTDKAQEDSVSAIDIIALVSDQMLQAMTLAWESDYVSQASSLSASVGTTNTAVTVAIMVSAQTRMRTAGVNADAMAYVMDNFVANSVEGLMMATGSSTAVYALSADRILAWNPTPGHGMSNRMIAGFRGFPVMTTGLCTTANSAVDANSMLICPSTAVNDASGATTHAMGIKRLPTFKADAASATAIGSRTTVMVLSSRVGFAELQDLAGTYILAKAT
jgi:hypothetical protein